jgi:environmental stress-induced protein Ves
MIITIKSEDQFKKIPWKNGKGETTELAINDGGTLKSFEWRISIANVVENGEFSNFSDYTRNLILIKGSGINLKHDNTYTDQLKDILDVAVFDGGFHTVGQLINGDITDLNVIVNTKKYQVMTTTYTDFTIVKLVKKHQYFIYCLQDETIISSDNFTLSRVLPAGNLMQVTELKQLGIKVSGRMMVIIKLTKLF